MPSHLDEMKRTKEKERFLPSGGDPQWILGDEAADELADKGAALAKPDATLEAKERFALLLTRNTQRMMCHIWAAHRGHVDHEKQDGREAELPDSEFDIPDPWGGNGTPLR